jgi:hypothetical protein
LADYVSARYPQPEWAAVFAADPEGVAKRLVPVMVRRCEPDDLLGQVVYGLRGEYLDGAQAATQNLDDLDRADVSDVRRQHRRGC